MEILRSIWDAFNAPLFSLGEEPVTPLSLVVLLTYRRHYLDRGGPCPLAVRGAAWPKWSA